MADDDSWRTKVISAKTAAEIDRITRSWGQEHLAAR
jgi:hypothetical protein